jgi:hypothetical protein
MGEPPGDGEWRMGMGVMSKLFSELVNRRRIEQNVRGI